MKKYFFIVFVFTAVAYIVFLPLLLNVQQICIQYKNWYSNHLSENSKVISITMDKNMFEKSLIHNKKEIVINNRLYDIVFFSINGSIVKMKIIEDNEEEIVLKRLKKILSILKKLNLNSLLFLFQVNIHQPLSLVAIESHLCKYCIYDFIARNNVILDKISPPPRLLL